MFRLRAALEDDKIIVSFIICPFEDIFTGSRSGVRSAGTVFIYSTVISNLYGANSSS